MAWVSNVTTITYKFRRMEQWRFWWSKQWSDDDWDRYQIAIGPWRFDYSINVLEV